MSGYIALALARQYRSLKMFKTYCDLHYQLKENSANNVQHSAKSIMNKRTESVHTARVKLIL